MNIGMAEILSKLLSLLFIILIYIFIVKIIDLINTDIRVMLRKKTGGEPAGTYLKLLNIRSSLNFPVSESYGIPASVKIGRSRKCDISIADPFLSSEHAEIILHSGAYYLNDLDSTNGTFLNDNRISGDPIELFDGDKTTMGHLSFIFINTENRGE